MTYRSPDDRLRDDPRSVFDSTASPPERNDARSVFVGTASPPWVVYLVTIDSDGAYYTVLHDASQLADFLADGTISLSDIRRVDRWEWDGDEWILTS